MTVVAGLVQGITKQLYIAHAILVKKPWTVAVA